MHLQILLEPFLLVAALSVDAFAASFAYGTNRIHISLPLSMLMSSVCSFMLAFSLFLGNLLLPFIHPATMGFSCFFLLFILGVLKIKDAIFSKVPDDSTFTPLSFREAFSLSIALSLDGLAAGFGAAFGHFNWLHVLILSFLTGILTVLLGNYCGKKTAERLPFDLSWVGGAMLLVLAFLKLRGRG